MKCSRMLIFYINIRKQLIITQDVLPSHGSTQPFLRCTGQLSAQLWLHAGRPGVGGCIDSENSEH